MEPGSQASEPAERPSAKFADLVGGIIALLTLTVPLFAIAHFSSVKTPSLQPPAQLLSPPRN